MFSSVTSILWCSVAFISCVERDLITTPSGPIRGTITRGFTNKEVDVYYGIPYAEYPAGPLRFAPPIEVKPWTEVLNATNSNSPSCYGGGPLSNMVPNSSGMSEDCLKIHIWVPKPTPKNASVMVYIHGGGFIAGNPLMVYENGMTLAGEEDVIVASMNYRLNIQGFLYFPRPDTPGNVGLLDQQMALKWIQKNIASFGGNPKDVTIFGSSAGGASVGFHLLAPNSRGLFQRAILMSGVPVAPWAMKHRGEVASNSKKIAQHIGCSIENINWTMLCLHNVHPNAFLEWPFGNYSTENMAPVGPTVDGNFIKDYPRNLLGNGSINDVDIMIGTTANEGSYFMLYDYPKMAFFPNNTLTRKEFDSMLNWTFRRHPASFVRNLSAIYVKPDTENANELRDIMNEIFSDFFFNCPSQEFADTYIQKSKKRVYRYVSDHHFPKFFNFTIPKWMGTPHGSDIILQMGLAAAGIPSFTQEEATLSKRVMKWWANFARTGNPNNGDGSPVEWPVSTKEKQEYLRIAVTPVVDSNFRSEKCKLLNDLNKRLT